MFFDKLINRLLPYFPSNLNESIRSDITQLAYAIGGDAHFFITQDGDLLSKSEAIHSELDILILSPGEFIVRLDEIIREVEYRPKQLAASHVLAISKISSEQLSQLYSIFHWSGPEERKRNFEARLRNFLANSIRYDTELCQTDSSTLALIVYDRGSPLELGIPLIKVSRLPLADTVLRHFLQRAVLISANEKRPFVRITDFPYQAGLEKALEECGFTKIGAHWVKLSLKIANSSASLLIELSSFKKNFPEMMAFFDNLITELSDAAEKQDSFRLADLERRLWPARILDADIPAYTVPIKPIWAQHLFDVGIARQTLCGSRDDLLLRNENVYYRSARPGRNILSPGRVLWYVSQDKNNPRLSSQIRACSSIDEVIIGRAKELFRRFERLGIYEWRDVRRTAKNDPNGQIMALRFSNTELLPDPVKLSTLRRIIREEEGKEAIVQSPQRILPRTFARIYQAAFPPEGGHQ